jgi:translocation and assembly module TamB
MRWIAPLALILLPVAAVAQDDRSYLTAFLEDNLSDVGRQVIITGFAGALSSSATIQQMTIADSEGVWLTLTDVALDWNRSALLSGNLSVNALTAGTITIARAPIADPDALPSPEAAPFVLPDLPVSVDIGRIAATKIILGQDVLGQPVEGSLDASMVLANGEGQAALTLQRTDGTIGKIDLSASYANATRNLVLDLTAEESSGGLAATMLGLPGAPAVLLRVDGAGAIDDYTADIALQTDGQDRLSGTVTLQGATDGAQRFAADISGNLAPLFVPAYAAFFGDTIALQATGTRSPTGQLTLPDFTLQTRALALNGSIALAADGLPQTVDVKGTIALPDASPVLLPLTTAQETRITRADLALQFDATQSPDWKGSFVIDALDRPDMKIAQLTLDGKGRIARDATGQNINANFTYAATGLAPTDASLAQALGDAITGTLRMGWASADGVLNLPFIALNGAEYGLTGSAKIDGLTTGLAASGAATLRADDLSRFAVLAGQPIAGAGAATVQGSGTLLGGTFDLMAEVNGTDLSVGIAEVDNLLRGPTQVSLSAKRDDTGTTLRDLSLRAATLTARGNGTIATAGSDITAMLDFTDLSVLGGPYRGALQADARFTGTPDAGQITLNGTGNALAIGVAEVDSLLRGPSQITLDASLTNGTVDLKTASVTAASLAATLTGRIATAGSDVKATLRFPDLSALGRSYRGALTADATFKGTPQTAAITLTGQGTNLAIGAEQPDKLLRGTSTLSADAAIKDGVIILNRAQIANPQVTADATGTVAGTTTNLDVNARLSNLALLLPEFPGAATLAGKIAQNAQGYTLDLRGQGPGQINATVKGTVAPNFARADLALNGSAQAGLADAFIDPTNISGAVNFDMALKGPLQPASLSGRLTLNDGRVAGPDLPFALTGVTATADLANGRANISMDSAISTGGQMSVNGTVALAPPFDANFTADLQRFVLRDPQLFQTRGNGTITLQGPLAGGAQIAGRIALIETEVRVPTSGFDGSGAIPDLQHVNESNPVRQTRIYAGLLGNDGSAGGASGPVFGIDLEIAAPNRVFIRGRGLDAELGGKLRLQGTTANITPIGAFELIRGRLDILGKRLDLSEALLKLEGDFIPYVRILASNESDGIVSSVQIEGRVDDPTVSFTSNPQLPEEEVLSRLLFGRGLQTLSALQAAQLAGAVATLAGRGGEGIVAKLRKGFGLDDLDLSTAEDGTTTVKAGKYLSRNLYTEVEVGQDGKSEISLNLDVTKNLTIKGSVGSDGETGLGIFLEKDY